MKNKHSVIVVPTILNLDNNTVKIVDPRGQNEGNPKEKLIESGYTLVSKNKEWDKLSHSLLEKSIKKQ